MGWLWGNSDNSNTGVGKDAKSNLDPSLREFLDKESKTRQQQQAAAAPSQETSSYRSQIGIPEPRSSTAPQHVAPENAVPNESLYQDGRYAHIWKDYRPLSEIESSTRSESERLTDVVETYNDRKARIGRAALENCADEQWAEHECFSNGGIQAKFFLCKEHTRALNRCFTMQSRFLKALGYLAMHRTPDEEERIQMHADKLYHQMLDRERQMKEAEEKSLPAPTFSPLITKTSEQEALGLPVTPPPAKPVQQREGLDMYTGEKKKALEKLLAEKTPAEREIELQLMAAEAKANAEYAAKVHEHFLTEKKVREDRRERGKETAGDTIKRLWGWDK